MAVTYGFYNSKEGDRRYDAIQMSSIFDGIILDGIFQNIGTSMMVKASTGMMVTVGIGRAWFDHTWTLNDSLLPLTLDPSEVIINRIDAIVLDVDMREDVRANSIIIVKGKPATNPVAPTLLKEDDHKQYPLALIRVNAGVTEITQSVITNKVGSADTPFIVCPLEHVSVDELLAQWTDEWNRLRGSWVEDWEAFYDKQTSEIEAENAKWKNMWETWYTTNTTTWETDWNTWFDSIKDIFSESDLGGVVTMIQNVSTEVREISEREFLHYYEMVNQITTINKDDSGNTTSIVTESNDGTSTTTFSDRSGNKRIVTMVVPNEGEWNYMKTVLIETLTDGKKITESYEMITK